MEEIYVNVECDKPVNTRRSKTGPSRSESRFHGAVVVFLGLLSFFLLVGLISLGVHYHYSVQRSAAEFSSVQTNLTERLQTSENKTSSLTEERDLLNISLIKMTKERDLLKTLQNRSCPKGWRMFLCGCYFLSTKSGSWDKGRQDCKNMDADLVVINSPEEQTFVSIISLGSSSAWIGLTDRAKEGTWTWVNNATLSLQYWGYGEPNNGGRGSREDCAEFITELKTWNDVPCKKDVRWICEKGLM